MLGAEARRAGRTLPTSKSTKEQVRSVCIVVVQQRTIVNVSKVGRCVSIEVMRVSLIFYGFHVMRVLNFF